MDCCTDQVTETVVMVWASQTGKTTVFNAAIGYYIHQDPAPIMNVQPTKEMAEAWSKDRFVPMVRDTPALAELVSIDSKRDGENTIMHKRFPGGNLTISGANSPASLASRPKRVMVLDEVDRFPRSAKKEGRPSKLAIKRTATFWNRKILKSSSPTIKGESEIEEDFERSDRRFYHVKCPHCGESQKLVWAQLKWPENQPENAHYVCGPNGCIISDGDKHYMLAHGEWIAEAPFKGTAGFHLSSLYSPWVTFADLAKKWVDAQGDPEKLKVFINTELAETYEENLEGDSVDEDSLVNRVEDYDTIAPDGVLVVTMAVDVQDDRLEYEIVGWGLEDETWSLRYDVIHGDPGTPEVWQELDDVLETKIMHARGIELPVLVTCIDAGGHHSESVYVYCKRKQRLQRRVYWVRGYSSAWRPVIGKPSNNNSHRVKGFFVGTDTAKDSIFSRLKIEEPGAGYCHFPAHYPEAYFKGLTSETKVKQWHKGKTAISYRKKTQSARNEPLDLRVYNMAAIKILKPVYEKWKLRMDKLTAKNPPPDQTKPAHNDRKEITTRKATRPRRGSSFVNRWRDT